ncbi:MAG: hypothetical protein M0R48_12005 [Candidatus Omnitrophica bacterium]|nr:hypothetical protein [Candidatus Omnitrophota bacterium]
MKPLFKIVVFLSIICALVTIPMVSATSNDKLPSQDEITQFVAEIKGSSASDILDKIKSDHPTWNADLLECPTCSGDKEAIALYSTASTEKGYGSTYCNETGVISPSTLKGYTLKESYKGTLEESENNTVENTSAPTSENVVEVNSSEHTYNDLKEFLGDYDGNTTYSQENIQSLQDTFSKAGWSTGIRWCIAVDTTDEGLLHIVLGA